jgi:hypothetical protein
MLWQTDDYDDELIDDMDGRKDSTLIVKDLSHVTADILMHKWAQSLTQVFLEDVCICSSIFIPHIVRLV